MVSLLGPLGAFNLATRLARAIEASQTLPRADRLSLRKIGAMTGIRHQRLSELLRDPGRATPFMTGELLKAASHPALQRAVYGARTIRLDAPAFTRESIRALQKPPGARGLAFVYETNSYAGGVGQTILSDVATEDPEDALALVPGGIDAVRSVLWYVG